MPQPTQPAWRNRNLFWQLFGAVIVGALLFAILNVASAGILVSIATVAIFFGAIAVVHYLTWGRSMDEEAIGPHPQEWAKTEPIEPRFNLELSDDERAELLRIIERAADHESAAVSDTRTALQKVLRDKLRRISV